MAKSKKGAKPNQKSKPKKKQKPKQRSKTGNTLGSRILIWAIIVISFVAGVLIYGYIFGAPANFIGGNPANSPVGSGARQFLGIVYEGGFVVPILFGLIIITIAISIERWISILNAMGKGNTTMLITELRDCMRSGRIDDAIKTCDKQKGSVGNVVKSVLIKYKEVEFDKNMNFDDSVEAIEKETREATNLELPMLEKNLSILATMGTISTLIALFGTVMGMIRAFAALGSSGAASSAQLATGISEALVNTALGIINAVLAIVVYNLFTTKIDQMTFAIDEASYIIIKTYTDKYKDRDYTKTPVSPSGGDVVSPTQETNEEN
jgi:biopolymer transport protein ExbB